MTSVLFIWALAQGVLAPPTTETFYTLEACQRPPVKQKTRWCCSKASAPTRRYARTVHRNELIRISDMFDSSGFGAAIVVFGLVCAVVGWGTIEVLLWLLSFVHISFGA